MKILYVHGYNGNPYGSSYQNLKKACKENHELYTIDYNPNFPKEAIKDIYKFVKENGINLVIGSSLGGFLTMNLYGVSRIVVNPCWDPANEINKLGYEGDTLVYEELLDGMTETLDIEELNLCSGVFVDNDELLGRKYVGVFNKYFRMQYDIEGEHKINEKMAEKIINKILPIHTSIADDFCHKLKEIDNAPWL